MKRRSGPGEADALGLLGLARRAGAVVEGVAPVREALRAGRAKLVILAGDASSVQLRKVQGVLAYQDVPARWVSTRSTLGRSIGRGDVSVIAVTTSSFAKQLSGRLPARSPKEEVGRNAGG